MNIDYRQLPEVQKELRDLEEMRTATDDDLTVQVGRTLYEQAGTRFLLDVRVTDPGLAQLVLLSIYDTTVGINLPGLEIAEIRLKNEDEKNAIKQWLQERLKELG
jgi:hypothetical protein